MPIRPKTQQASTRIEESQDPVNDQQNAEFLTDNATAEEATDSASVNLDELDLTPVQIGHKSRETAEAAKVSVVNTSKNGKRVAIAKDVIERIGSPDKLKVMKGVAGFVFLPHTADNENCFVLRESGNKKIIYSGELVADLTTSLNLDFTDRSTVSFSKVQYVTNGNDCVGFLIKKP